MQDEVESKTLTLIQEDIVMTMEVLELTDAQTQALLDFSSPLADVYRHFEKLEPAIRSRRNANPPPRRNEDRNDERGKAETGGTGEFPGFPGGAGSD